MLSTECQAIHDSWGAGVHMRSCSTAPWHAGLLLHLVFADMGCGRIRHGDLTMHACDVIVHRCISRRRQMWHFQQQGMPQHTVRWPLHGSHACPSLRLPYVALSCFVPDIACAVHQADVLNALLACHSQIPSSTTSMYFWSGGSCSTAQHYCQVAIRQVCSMRFDLVAL